MPNCRVLETGIYFLNQPYHINGDKGYKYDHWGVDITDYSQGYNRLCWIVAHSDGVVVGVRTDSVGYEGGGSYGNYVLLRHSNGCYTLYAHLAFNTIKVAYGQKVTKGQILAYMDNTGTSEGGHLHFEIRDQNGWRMDPEPWLNKAFPGEETKIWKQQWHLYENGKMLTGWQKVNSKWYYMDANGIMITGWLWDKNYNGWFLFALSGEMLTGWQKVNNKWYYMQPSNDGTHMTGIMRTGWLKDAGKWYYLDPATGAMYANGTYTINGKSYSFRADGSLVE